MSSSPNDALAWAVKEMELHSAELRQIVARNLSVPEPPLTVQDLRQVLLKIDDMAQWIEKVAVQCAEGECAEVVEKNTESSACLEMLQKMNIDRTAYQQRVENAAKEKAREIATCAERKLSFLERQLTVQERMLQIQERQEEERVMSVDVEKMAPWVREYYINKQKEIAAKSHSGEGSKSTSPGV